MPTITASKVSYYTATAHLTYEYDQPPGTVAITADHACLLHFPESDFGEEYVFFDADETKVFTLPPEPVHIDFDVYVLSVKEVKRGQGVPPSEPPIIRP